MNLAAFLVSIVAGIAKVEGPRLFVWLEPKLPSVVDTFVTHMIGLQSVQDWAAGYEAKGEAAATELLAKGIHTLEAEALSHVHGQLGVFLTAQVAKLERVVFTPEDTAKMEIILLSGKLGDAYKLAVGAP